LESVDLKVVALDTLGGGVALELFDRALAEVLKNIDDPNTKATSPRKIIVEVRFTPTEDRESAQVLVIVSSKLESVKPAAMSVFLGRERNKLVAYSRDPLQQTLPMGRVIEMPEGGAQ
jgi:hypothetical protein